MEVKEILKHVDHTLLTQTATWEEIKQICDDAVLYGTASVCIPPSYVKAAAEYMLGRMYYDGTVPGEKQSYEKALECMKLIIQNV